MLHCNGDDDGGGGGDGGGGVVVVMPGEVSEHEGSGRNQSNSALLASSTGSSSSSSSMSDSDSDGLMVSQELEPGFNTDCHLKLNEHVSQSQLPLQPDFVANSARPANLTTQ